MQISSINLKAYEVVTSAEEFVSMLCVIKAVTLTIWESMMLRRSDVLSLLSGNYKVLLSFDVGVKTVIVYVVDWTYIKLHRC